jgi:hypothetical protein
VDSVTVLAVAMLIGALPATFLGGPWLGVFGGLFGLIGGVAFCVMNVLHEGEE